MATKTEILSILSKEKICEFCCDYALTQIFRKCIGEAYPCDIELLHNAEYCMEDWKNEMGMLPPVQVNRIYYKCEGDWYHAVDAIYLHGVLNGLYVSKDGSPSEVTWRNDTAGLETIRAMINMHILTKKKLQPEKCEGEVEEWLDEWEKTNNMIITDD
jgi:hypothetical protein